jgi:pimeloyl-ACP methyl ester carboxylesterase
VVVGDARAARAFCFALLVALLGAWCLPRCSTSKIEELHVQVQARSNIRDTHVSRVPVAAPGHSSTREHSRAAWFAGIAAAAVGAALLVQERTRNAERRHPPAGKFLTVEGVRLHYVEYGEGEPLVLIHGNTVTSQDFLLGDLVDMAERKYRVLIFDRPGYGYSNRPGERTRWSPEEQARVLHAALLRLGVRKPVVLGHSWGAMVAMAMALDHPDFMRGLVLESGYYYPTARPDVLIASIPAIPVLGDFLRYTFSPLLGRLGWSLVVKSMFAPSKVTEHFRQIPAWISLRPSQMRANAEDAAAMVPAAARMRRRYAGMKVPTVIIAGGKDPVVHPEPQSGRLHGEIAGSALLIMPGLGHMVHHLAPGEVMKAIECVAGLGREDRLEHPDPVATVSGI